MRPLKILIGPNPILEKVCRPDFRIPEWLIAEMFRLMRQNKGLGLAAPQIGIDARLFIAHWGEIFVNPVVTQVGENTVCTQEGCLSFPGIICEKSRYAYIEVNGRRYQGPEAVVVQHEFDHLNGITIIAKA
jgi:peptide deformylase